MAHLYQKHISTQSHKTTASTMRIFADQLRMTTKRDNDYSDSGLWPIGECYHFGARIYDSRVGRWYAQDALSQFVGTQYGIAANNPILLIDIDGNSVLGVDKEGNIYIQAKEGDHLNSIIDFFGGAKTALKYVSVAYIYSNQKKDKLHPIYRFTKGKKIVFTRDDVYSKATKEAKETKEKYQGTENRDVPNFNPNYNCHQASCSGSKGIEFHEKVEMDYGDTDILENCEAGDVNSVTFGESLVTYGFKHTAVFFGTSKDGSVYIFTKNGGVKSPTITKASNLTDSEKNSDGARFGPVRNIDRNAAEDDNSLNVDRGE